MGDEGAKFRMERMIRESAYRAEVRKREALRDTASDEDQMRELFLEHWEGLSESAHRAVLGAAPEDDADLAALREERHWPEGGAVAALLKEQKYATADRPFLGFEPSTGLPKGWEWRRGRLLVSGEMVLDAHKGWLDFQVSERFRPLVWGVVAHWDKWRREREERAAAERQARIDAAVQASMEGSE